MSNSTGGTTSPSNSILIPLQQPAVPAPPTTAATPSNTAITTTTTTAATSTTTAATSTTTAATSTTTATTSNAVTTTVNVGTTAATVGTVGTAVGVVGGGSSSVSAREKSIEYLFLKGFGEYFQSALFADCIVSHKADSDLATTYNLHQLILAHSSEYFATLLKSNKQSESDTDSNTPNSGFEGNVSISDVVKCSEIPCKYGRSFVLELHDPLKLLPSVFKYMYEGTIQVNEENAVGLLALAEQLKVEDLQRLVSDYITATLSRSTVIQILRKALEISTIEDIIGKCILVIARNFSQLYTSNISLDFLPLDIFLKILRHESLTVSSEYSLYKTIQSYLKFQYKLEEEDKQDIPDSVKNTLFENVRLPYMKFDELEEVLSDGLVPTMLLAEALMVRVALHECPEKVKRNTLRFQKRIAYGRLFEYSADFDEKGVFYWIGTKGGTVKWRNPSLVENGVKITASSIEKGDPIALAGRRQAEVWTMDVPSSWFAIDLGQTRSLILTFYTLRHGGSSKQDSLRNWVLQASDDCKTWVVLIRHRDEDILGSKNLSCSWPVTTCTKPYRYFRVLQTGHNASNHNFLAISGVELYGELYESS